MAQRAPGAAAETAAEAIRELNHLTIFLDLGGYTHPADVADVLAQLTVAVQRMPQALDQAARWIENEQEAGRLAHDAGADVADHVQRMTVWLANARQSLGEAERWMRESYRVASALRPTDTSSEAGQ
jgi:hypothetical protein